MPARKRTRARASGEDRSVVRKAVTHGRDLATDVIKARDRRRTLARAAGPSNGLIIAEGDSWFDYPFFNILERLEDKFDFVVESAAHNGDTVESMAYDASQVAKVARLFEKLGGQGTRPRAILLSGGGNDIAGDEFAIMLNHAASGLPVLNERVVEGIINERIRFAMVSVISAVTTLARRYFGQAVPILVHGYGHAIPDGRGYLGGALFLPGPWLKPGFIQKGYGDLRDNAAIVAELIDRFNAMLETIPAGADLSHVRYVDLRKTLTSDLQGYKKSWGDELHPTKPGFEAVAEQIADILKDLPPTPRMRLRSAAGVRRTTARRTPRRRGK
jgi:lysophospholipase L1-like esterase